MVNHTLYHACCLTGEWICGQRGHDERTRAGAIVGLAYPLVTWERDCNAIGPSHDDALEEPAGAQL